MKIPDELFPKPKEYYVVGPETFDPECPLCRAFAEAPPGIFGATRIEDGHAITEILSPEEVRRMFEAMKDDPDAWTFLADPPSRN